MKLAVNVAANSKVSNRHIGAVLVRYQTQDNKLSDTIVSIGWNGIPRGVNEVDNLCHYDIETYWKILKQFCIQHNIDRLLPYLHLDNAELLGILKSFRDKGLHPASIFANYTSSLLRDLDISETTKDAIMKSVATLSLAERPEEPRRLLGCASGECVKYIVDAHAERNAIYNAARTGVSTVGTTMYISCGTPCKECATAIVQAGVCRVVAQKVDGDYIRNDYNFAMSRMLFDQAGIKFDLLEAEN